MSTYVGRVGSCCNNYNVSNGMMVAPYEAHDVLASSMGPRIKAYSGWASYKNVKSGQYNRQHCWKCADFKGFPQSPGVYDRNIVDTPPPMPNFAAMKAANDQYQVYQAARMSNGPGSYGSGYVNYLNTECGALYPKRYVKGNWPDEYLIYTNTPANGCKSVKEGTPICTRK